MRSIRQMNMTRWSHCDIAGGVPSRTPRLLSSAVRPVLARFGTAPLTRANSCGKSEGATPGGVAPAPEEEARGAPDCGTEPLVDEGRRGYPQATRSTLAPGRTPCHGTGVPAGGGTLEADQSSGILIQPWRMAYTTPWVRSLH